MTKIYAQFADPTKQIIISVFGCPQDETCYPNQDEIDASDIRYQAFMNPTSSLAGAQASQILEVSAACQVSIVSGFSSNALGASHAYPSKLTDQQNLTASVLASMYPGLTANWITPFWCKDGDGNWAWVDHTVSQIQQVGSDGKVAILACMDKNAALQAQILAATDIDAVLAIKWSQP
jgi:hypothetical protein